jgi:hypothetical protein
MKTIFSITVLILYTPFIIAQSPIYLNPNASIESRVNDPLERMKIEEKIGQMSQADPGVVIFSC